MSFTSVRAALKTKLDEIKTNFPDAIQVIYDYVESGISGYPAVLIESQSMGSDFGSQAQNLRTYKFSLTIHQTYEDAGRDEASKRIDATVDTIINELDEDFTLGGAVTQILPVGANKTFIEDSEAGKKIVFEIDIELQEFSEIYNNC